MHGSMVELVNQMYSCETSTLPQSRKGYSTLTARMGTPVLEMAMVTLHLCKSVDVWYVGFKKTL